MKIAPSGKKLSALAVGFLLLGLVPALSQQLDHGFMPKGGKTLLLELLGSAPSDKDMRAIIEARRSEPEWRETMGPRARGLSERELRTLTAYLATNMPVADPESVAARAAKPDDLAPALPRDGRELAWQECQFCHSLFTSHLTQSRDVQAWLNMFQSPFHRELKMTAQERREFSSYSAINMPMRTEDVPSDLRF
jgi:hypothetical protein